MFKFVRLDVGLAGGSVLTEICKRAASVAGVNVVDFSSKYKEFYVGVRPERRRCRYCVWERLC
jgi:hypothetical protein